jgi:hypothetical protein
MLACPYSLPLCREVEEGGLRRAGSLAVPRPPPPPGDPRARTQHLCHPPASAARTAGSDTTTNRATRSVLPGCGGGQGAALCQSLDSGPSGSSVREPESDRAIPLAGPFGSASEDERAGSGRTSCALGSGAEGERLPDEAREVQRAGLAGGEGSGGPEREAAPQRRRAC